MSNTIIGVVGPCAAGKSTLVAKLKALGYQAKHIAQEHSYVQAMWQRIGKPDILIYLDVSYSSSINRKNLNWTVKEYDTQIQRLTHARQHADIYIQTDQYDVHQVQETVLSILTKLGSPPPVSI